MLVLAGFQIGLKTDFVLEYCQSPVNLLVLDKVIDFDFGHVIILSDLIGMVFVSFNIVVNVEGIQLNFVHLQYRVFFRRVG